MCWKACSITHGRGSGRRSDRWVRERLHIQDTASQCQLLAHILFVASIPLTGIPFKPQSGGATHGTAEVELDRRESDGEDGDEMQRLERVGAEIDVGKNGDVVISEKER